MNFYSARLLYVILVANGPGKKRNGYDETVIMFRARDFEHAFERALEIGRASETDYLNYKEQKVRWALVEILAIIHVGRKIDGAEVSSHLHWRTSKDPIAPDRIFRPELSQPQ